MPSKTLPLKSEPGHAKTFHEKMESIVSQKKSVLMTRVGLPTRIQSLLGQRRDEKCSAEILSYAAFPYSSHEKHLDQKLGHFRQLLRVGLNSGGLRTDDLLDIKTAIQHAEHLTEHTRITIMGLLDEKN